MLNSREKKKLRLGLSANQPENELTNLEGKSYSALAKELDTKYGIKATPRSIRHYVYSLSKEDATWSRKALTRGRPTKTTLSASDLLVKEVSAYLMQLTGFSESGIYELLRNATNKKWPAMGKVTFHKLFKEGRKPKSVLSIEVPDTLLSHCCLVLSQTRLSPVNDDDQWVLLWGIEASTGYFNFQLINLIPASCAVTATRGRPKKASFSEVVLIDHEGDVALPATILRDFLEDCQRRLCLPLTRAVLPGGYNVAEIQLSATPPIHFYSDAPKLNLSQEAMSALPSIEVLRDHLEATSIQHYKQSARQHVSALRRCIRELVEDYRQKLASSRWPQFLRERMTEAAALADFYNSQPKFQTRTIFQKSSLIRLRYKRILEEPSDTG